MKVKVLGDRLLVKVETDEKVTKAGIIIPSTTKEERHYDGVVVGMGDHKDVEESGVKIGDHVWYQKGYNIEIKDAKDGVVYDIVSIFDVLAVDKGE